MANNSMQDGSPGRNLFCEPFNLQVLFWVVSTMLVLSVFWNIFCCVSRCCSGKGICQTRKRQRRSTRQMEENPIYGNISYMQTSMTLLTKDDAPHSWDQQRVISDSQSKTQDCYANLTLKAPRVQSGRSSPQIQYSDVVQLEEPPRSEKEDEGNTDAVSTMSDLYASVQNQRTKTVDTADGGEGYANHL
ncbi:signaling threshold-regulating transmembrane adapter 1-like isoform X2 [Chelmon rostratus]|uniref:signaling threshold-regulating transmembrane adapter 1-like isoform X2 n=1 Tax=Chelmon rostratus TaxID=109905 RepID=UPI001BE96FAB|nr:signaling threshold-regulating transmembrane adapter 1-like isoform X2 [Chelmon rostratus]